ncbi:hypothetical protein MTAT_04790 [Moorella thermoacetica]|uniref:Gp5/Type VI secretion system Vgr protein OB-fold domain-containing protein n=1 Tax=Neomoorella thermoacetica TaxID=1525 RepID=A0AAC9MVR8_NEOTH|nr:hypothetical protein [Moorella thermoacetica]AOQ24722.1 hypothetical protein Maut_02294 [Moorella thermoacetica]TYL15740.1 hypothetical protein MTAT_04790 [Moorella thermoacetica]
MEPINANPAVRAIIEKAVKPVLESRHPDTSGRIIQYYPQTNTADIEINIGGAKLLRYDVPVPKQVGLIGRDPQPGDEVWVSFAGGDPGSPYITMLYDSNYLSRTRSTLKLQARSNLPFSLLGA